jgi:peptidoglycan hydrolase-like protein with peptidoglycan-binding domain
MASISRPVGLSASRSFNNNSPRDVKTVQGLLSVASSLQNRRDWNPGPITGRMTNSKADSTVRAILAFQRPFLRNPTGIIDPGSVAILKLNEFTKLKINRNYGPVLIPIAKSRRVVGKK